MPAPTRGSCRRKTPELRQEFRTKQEAVDFAKERARKQEPTQVKMHKSDGNMHYESTYGQDPARCRS
jgi:hypothetical protein